MINSSKAFFWQDCHTIGGKSPTKGGCPCGHSTASHVSCTVLGSLGVVPEEKLLPLVGLRFHKNCGMKMHLPESVTLGPVWFGESFLAKTSCIRVPLPRKRHHVIDSTGGLVGI